jgi:hypothetical protein
VVTELVEVYADEASVFDVVFVHGLDGHARKSWSSGRKDSFWPEWLALDVGGLAVWSMGYDAASSRWLGQAMPIQDRAINLLAQLQNNGIGQRPLCFITHSMGGLVVKEMLLHAAEGRAGYREFASTTRGVVFLATPHTGSDLANVVRALGVVYRGTPAVEGLRRSCAHLRQLNDRYRDWVADPITDISHQVFSETQPTKGIHVVDAESANPGLAGVRAIPVEANHIDICKPTDRKSVVYGQVLRFVSSLREEVSNPNHARWSARPQGRRRRPAHPVPRAPSQRQARLGLPIADYDPLALDVKRAIDVPCAAGSLSVMPPYVCRPHDVALSKIVEEAAAGVSSMAVLVGDSSTGKTRACWEAVQHLPGEWRLVRPTDPSRIEAALEAVATIEPRSVLWLDELQLYLLADIERGGRLAAGLQTLLTDSRRAPVLVLGTIWRDDWHTLTERPDSGTDPHEQARHLLTGRAIAVPESFTARDLAALRQAAQTDPRLLHAAEHADAARITQHLAGVPQLMTRYRTAPPVARAIIHLAMDAGRLGHPVDIPRWLLERAGPHYLADHEWKHAGSSWLDEALRYTEQACNGTLGPLVAVRPRPGERSGIHDSYRLRDYLEQLGRRERAGIFPPAAFWDVLADSADFDLVRGLAAHAEARGRYQRASRLYQTAAERGDTRSLSGLASLRERAGDAAAAEKLALSAFDHGHRFALEWLANAREKLGDSEGAAAMRRLDVEKRNGDEIRVETMSTLTIDPVDDPVASALYRRVVEEQDNFGLVVVTLLHQAKANPANLEQVFSIAVGNGDAVTTRGVGIIREYTGDLEGAAGFYRRAADAGDNRSLLALARLQADAGDNVGAESLYELVGASSDPAALLILATRRYRGGDAEQAYELALRASDLGSTEPLLRLAELHEESGDHASAVTLIKQAADCGNVRAMAFLAAYFHREGDSSAAERIAERAAELGSSEALLNLAALHINSDLATAETLLRKAYDLNDPRVLEFLALLRCGQGDPEEGKRLMVRAVNLAHLKTLDLLAELTELLGDPVAAKRIRRFGLTDDGAPAQSAGA